MKQERDQIPVAGCHTFCAFQRAEVCIKKPTEDALMGDGPEQPHPCKTRKGGGTQSGYRSLHELLRFGLPLCFPWFRPLPV